MCIKYDQQIYAHVDKKNLINLIIVSYLWAKIDENALKWTTMDKKYFQDKIGKKTFNYIDLSAKLSKFLDF